jgi:cytochrome c oxidase subunit 2
MTVHLAFIQVGNHSVFDAAGDQGAHIEGLFWFMFWVCLVVYVAIVALFTLGSRRTYSGENDPLPVIKNPQGDQAAQWYVGFAMAATVLVLFLFLALSMRTGADVQDTAEHNGVTIQVTGHQWWWEVTYLDSDPSQTIETANEIHVPVGQRVAIVTNSADVIHSFWVPSITGKRDLIPGDPTAFNFTVDRAGTYRGMCAEFCGLQHAHMDFSVIAEAPEAFQAWKQAQIVSAKEPSDAETARGRNVFMTHSCVMCHTIRGTSAGSRVGPDLTHLASRGAIAANLLPNNTGALAGWILDPQRMKPGTEMPPNDLSGGDLQALVTYLQSLQ